MITRAEVDICILTNAYWSDAFQFGTVGDVSWSFTNKTFHLDVKASVDDATAATLLHLSTANARILVDDAVTRILHFHVTDADIQASIPPATYVYDLVMTDVATSVRTVLMGGKLTVEPGVTQD